jgi:hypothetical protein
MATPGGGATVFDVLGYEDDGNYSNVGLLRRALTIKSQVADGFENAYQPCHTIADLPAWDR